MLGEPPRQAADGGAGARSEAASEGAMEDRDYFYRRAEEEIDRARASSAEREVSFHYRLAGLYLDRIYGTEGDPRAALRTAG
jgi:hypothetical protein